MGANSRQWAAIIRERLALPDLDADAIQDAIVDGVLAHYRNGPPPGIPGAPEAVRRIAAGRPVAIASSSHPAVIRAAVDALGLHGVFGAIVSSDEVTHGKPAPDVYLLAATRLGVEPARCLVVEDSVNGVRAGKAAGMTVVLVPNASVPPAEGARELADLVLDRLADLDPDAPAALTTAARRAILAPWSPPRRSAPSIGRSASASSGHVCAVVVRFLFRLRVEGRGAPRHRVRRSTASTT